MQMEEEKVGDTGALFFYNISAEDVTFFLFK